MVDVRDNDYRTPLHEAAAEGRLAVVQFLVQEARARIHDQTITGDTPMHLACMSDHAPVVQFLLDCKARLDILNREGLTPVDCARLSNSAAILMCLDQFETTSALRSVASTPVVTKPIMSDPALPNGAPNVVQYTTEDKIAGMVGTPSMPASSTTTDVPPPPPPVMSPKPPTSPPPPTIVVPAREAAQSSYYAVPLPAPAQSAGPSGASIKSRLAKLEAHFSLPSTGSIQQRVSALERQILRTTSSTGTLNARLTKLESELVDWQRVAAVESALQVVPRQEGTLFERLTDLELELLGQSFEDSVSIRLGRLEKASSDWSGITRLENELGIFSAGQKGSRLERLGAIELELFGEISAGTTIASRLSRVEAELFGA